MSELKDTLKNQIKKKSGTAQLEMLRKRLLDKAASLNRAVKKAESVVEKDRFKRELKKILDKIKKLNIPDSVPGILG